MLHAVNEEWLFGEIGSRSGQFPIQFIDHVPPGISVLGNGSSTNTNTSPREPADRVAESMAMWDESPHQKHEVHKV